MNDKQPKRINIIQILILILLAVSLIYSLTSFLLKDENNSLPNEEVNNSTSESEEKITKGTIDKNNNVIERETNINELYSLLSKNFYFLEDINSYQSFLDNNELVLVEFRAEWCPYCKEFEKNVPDIIENIEGLRILAVDIDLHRNLALEYGVTGTPTLILYNNGFPIDRTVGFASTELLIDWLKTGDVNL